MQPIFFSSKYSTPYSLKCTELRKIHESAIYQNHYGVKKLRPFLINHEIEFIIQSNIQSHEFIKFLMFLFCFAVKIIKTH